EEDSSPVQHSCDPLLELYELQPGVLRAGREVALFNRKRCAARGPCHQRTAAGPAALGARGCTRESAWTRRPSSSPGWILISRIRLSVSSFATYSESPRQASASPGAADRKSV